MNTKFQAITILTLSSVVAGCALNEAMVSTVVTDENKNPLQRAYAVIAFEIPYKSGPPAKTAVKGYTNKEGKFSGSARTTGRIYYMAQMKGYYDTLNLSYDFLEHKGYKWLPWNPTFPIILKKIGNPVAMYAKTVRTEIPKENEGLGFDLTVGDWTAPYGQGKTDDFIFIFQKNFVDINSWDANLTLCFTNDGDGIQSVFSQKDGSKLRLSGLAPETGYSNKLEMIQKLRPLAGLSMKRENINYYFRVRTIIEKDKVLKAMYGKIYGEFYIDALQRGTKPGYVIFQYYLNPDYTRNVEFDPAQNYFKNLKVKENVRDP